MHPSGDLGDRLRSAGQLGRPVLRIQRPARALAGRIRSAAMAGRRRVLARPVGVRDRGARRRAARRSRTGAGCDAAGGLLAAGLLILPGPLVPTIWMTYIVWAALGLCMASILYEPVFAIVGRAFADPEGRLRAIATVTVTGGLASTAFLPGTSALVTRFGWRGAVVVLAIIIARRRRSSSASLRFATWRGRRRPSAMRSSDRLFPVTATRHCTASTAWSLLFAISIIVNSAVSSNLVASLIDRGLAPTFAATVAGIVRHHAAAGPAAAQQRAHHASAGAAARRELRTCRSPDSWRWSSHGPIAMWIGVIVFAGGTGLTTLARPYLVLHEYGPERAGYANGSSRAASNWPAPLGPVAAAAAAGTVGYGPVFVGLCVLLAAAILSDDPAKSLNKNDILVNFQPTGLEVTHI